MNIPKFLVKTAFAASLAFSAQVWAVATPGQAAPDFNTLDAAGKTHKLDQYKGKWVVLEWFNEGCPFVKKHYGSHNMQELQKKYTEQGVTWLTVISSAEGKQGYVTSATAEGVAKNMICLQAHPFCWILQA